MTPITFSRPSTLTQTLWPLLLLVLVCGACDRGEKEPVNEPTAKVKEDKGAKKAAEPSKETAKEAQESPDPEKTIEDADAGMEEEASDAEDDAEEADSEDQTPEPRTDLEILESVMAADVKERKPVGVAGAFDWSAGQIWSYIAVRNDGEPTTVKMVWRKDGKEKFGIDVKVGKSKAWRTWSRKRMRKKDVGAWTVDVVEPGGQVLKTMSFEVTGPKTP